MWRWDMRRECGGLPAPNESEQKSTTAMRPYWALVQVDATGPWPRVHLIF
jgi:hypothetical protein